MIVNAGLAIALLGIDEISQIQLNPFLEALFENLVVLEILKQRLNSGKSPNIFFWRDNMGNEVDLLLEKNMKLLPVEIKSGKTVTSYYTKELRFWNKITGTQGGYVVYDDDLEQKRREGYQITPWRKMIEKIEKWPQMVNYSGRYVNGQKIHGNYTLGKFNPIGNSDTFLKADLTFYSQMKVGLQAGLMNFTNESLF